MNKIFVVGFPKAGTTSIQDALVKSGVNSLHWGWYDSPSHLPEHLIRFNKKVTSVGMMMQYAKKNNKPLLYFFNQFDAFTQMDISLNEKLLYWPQLTDVPILDKQYPNSKFIFNTRPISKWINSINRWGDLRTRLTKLEIPGLPSGFGYKDKELADWHYWHKSNMISYFGNSNKFIIFDIENDNPKVVADFLNIKFDFGHKNENKRNSIYNSPCLSTAIYN